MGFLDDVGLTQLWSKINDKISVAKTEVVQVANDYTDSQISQINGELPDYWMSHVDEQVAVIRQVMETSGRNRSSFLWYTDAHWTYNYQRSPVILKYLYGNTPIQKINFGGDIVNTEGATDYEYLYEWRNLIRTIKHHSVRGNHDDDIFGVGNSKGLYAFLMAAEETPDIVRGSDFFYFIDEPNEKTRYLYLDTQQCTSLTAVGDPEMVGFIIDALKRLPAGWHVVAISHIWWLYSSTSTPTVGSVPDYCQQLLDLFDAYNLRYEGTVTVNGTVLNYDFVNCNGKVEFCIGGHTHVDYDFTSTYGIPVILTETDSRHVRSGLSCVPGQISENSVSAIIADYDNKKINVVRVGRGESREVMIIHSAPSEAVNQIPLSTDTDGSLYNGGVGFASNTRLNSSGNAVTYTGVETTGFIPVKSGDTIYFKNITCNTQSGTTYSAQQYLAFYDSNKTKINSTLVHGYSAWSNDYYGVVDENYNPVKLYLGGWFTDFMNGLGVDVSTVAYFRISAEEIDSTSIITINEEIE